MEAVIQKVTDAVRNPMQQRVAPFVNQLFGGRLSPDMVTLISLAGHVPIAWLIATQHNYWAAVLLIVFGLLDALDGALARVQNVSRPRGMLLDSATDLMKQILLYVGAAYALVSATNHQFLVVWAVAACGCSLLVSYISARGDAIIATYKARGHGLNKTFRGGLFPFQVRMFVLVIGLLVNHLALAIIVITVGATYTALDRLVMVFKHLNELDVQS